MTNRSESVANQQLQASSLHIGSTFHAPGKGYVRKPRGIFAFLYRLMGFSF